MPAGKGYRAWGECGAPWRAQSEPAVCKNEARCQRVTAVPMEGPKGGRLGVHLGKQNNNWKKIYTHTQKSLKFLTKEWRIQQSRSSWADRGEASLIYQLTSALFMGHQGEAERKEGDGERGVGGGNTEGLKYAWGLALLGARKKKWEKEKEWET